ncbi:sulfur carrier protein ThiS [Helicobacter sp.]|uniref:sulfur carrier protein ThiS n=1 Tax=Helicobacter sp. TaxID=218 RepID=UPI00341DCCAE
MMTILLNGKKYEINADCTLLALIENLGITHKAMAVAINTQVIKKPLWESYVLQNNDEVEILDFVGGG